MDTAIFVCFTPYQLLNAVYYGVKLRNESARILVWHNYTKYRIDISRFSSAFDEIIELDNFYEESFFKRQYHKCLYGGWMFRRSRIYRILSQLDLRSTVLFLFSDQHIVSRKVLTTIGGIAKDVVLVEEGMATYLIRSHKIQKSRDWFINLLLGAKYEPYIGANPLVHTFFVKHPEALPEEKKKNRTVIRQNNVFREDLIWKDLFDDILSTISFLTNKKKTLLWLGQPLEMDGVSADEQIRWLRKVANSISDDYQVLIKTHPREAPDKYMALNDCNNVSILQLKEYSWIPVEILASLIQPNDVLTAYSTAANNILELNITCKIIYCYSAFRLTVGKEIEQYISSNPNIYCIREPEELIQALNEQVIISSESLVNLNSDLTYISKIMSK